MATAEIEQVIHRLRSVVAEREEWSMMNSIPPPSREDARENHIIPEGYSEFLRLADGVTCGVVTLFPVSLSDSMQFYCDPIEDACVLLDREGWFCCGVVNDEPLFIERISGRTFHFADFGVQWWESPNFENLAKNFEEFFLRHVAGPEYEHLSPEGSADDWIDVLRRADRI